MQSEEGLIVHQTHEIKLLLKAIEFMIGLNHDNQTKIKHFHFRNERNLFS